MGEKYFWSAKWLFVVELVATRLLSPFWVLMESGWVKITHHATTTYTSSNTTTSHHNGLVLLLMVVLPASRRQFWADGSRTGAADVLATPMTPDNQVRLVVVVEAGALEPVEASVAVPGGHPWPCTRVVVESLLVTVVTRWTGAVKHFGLRSSLRFSKSAKFYHFKPD